MENIDFLDAHFSDLVNITYTKEMEDSLDLIASGKLDYIEFLKGAFDHLEGSVKKMEDVLSATEENYTCPNCGAPLVKRTGKYGSFYGCSNYPKCKYILPKK